MFDLIVLGAGPAGAACAYAASKAGLRVALLDKHRFPRDKLCGGGLTNRTSGILRTLYGGLPPVAMETRTEISFFGFGEDLGTSTGAPIRLVMRREFDAALVQLALDAGAQDFTGHAAALGSQAVVVGDRQITAPLIVAADGVNSPTAKRLFGAAFDREKIGFALEIEHPDPQTSRPLRIDFGAAEWGYGWQFPKTQGVTIGIGGVLSRNPDMKSALAQYFKSLDIVPETQVKGQFLPFGAFRKVPGRERILLAGDAAGLVDPITGEGIAYALQSGVFAAQSAVAALAQGTPDRALTLYRGALRPIHRNLRQAQLLRHLIFQPRLRPAFLRRFAHSRRLRQDYLRLLAGEFEYPQLLRKTAQRMPRFAYHLIRGI